MTKSDLMEKRKLWFRELEQKLQEMHTKEDDSLFYYHSSEDRIVLSHAMFWTMTQLQFFKSKMRKEKFFLLLRQYEEEMLDAFLQDDDYFPELLHYCNIQYELLPTILMASHLRSEKEPGSWRLLRWLLLVMLVICPKTCVMHYLTTSITISIRSNVGRSSR